MKRFFRTILLAAALCALSVSSVCAYSVTVPVLEGEDQYDVSVALPDEELVWFASYDDTGKLLALEQMTAEELRALETEGAQSASFFMTDKSCRPERQQETVWFSGWQERSQFGGVCADKGEYGSAVSAYSAAIELAPDVTQLYVDRGEALVHSGETEENLSAAGQDFERAVELDGGNAAAYLGLADVSIRRGEYGSAKAVLETGLRATGDNEIRDKLDQLKSGSSITDSDNKVRRSLRYQAGSNELSGHTEYFYDALGRRWTWTIYDRSGTSEERDEFGISKLRTCVVLFVGDTTREAERLFYEADGTLSMHDTFVYDENGFKRQQWRYEGDSDVPNLHFEFYYDEFGREIKNERYDSDGTLTLVQISEYDATGKLVVEKTYDGDGNLTSTAYFD